MDLQRLRDIAGPRWAAVVTFLKSFVTRQQMEETTASNLRQPISPPVEEMTGTNTPEARAESLGRWKKVVTLVFILASAFFLFFLTFGPNVLKKEIPNSVWIIAAFIYGVYTLLWMWVTFEAFKREGRVGRSWLNFSYAAFCFTTYVSAVFKYCEENQTFFSMFPLLVVALLSFVPL